MSVFDADNPLHHVPLGKQSTYVSDYAPELLAPIPRAISRDALHINAQNLPFTGEDIWTGYELSWLNPKGLPQVGCAEFRFPCTSAAIVESKSFKLYLNSFNQTVFASLTDLISVLERDLSAVAQAPVMVRVLSLKQSATEGLGWFAAECLDQRDVTIDTYQPDAQLLTLEDESVVVEEALYSDLLKSNCPVTGQPDWASIYIAYQGSKISRDSLLRYIVSYRQHQDFHENCVERIFNDIKTICQTRELTVYARYTRRGGLDINPFRTDCGATPDVVRLARQ